MNNAQTGSGWSLPDLARLSIMATRDVLVAREGGRVTPFEIGMQTGAASPTPTFPTWALPAVLVGGLVFLAVRK